MNRNTVGVVSIAAILVSIAGCTANPECSGTCSDESGTQVNASVMNASESVATSGGTSPEDINNLERSQRYNAATESLSFEGGRVSIRPEFAVARDAAASQRAMAGYADAFNMNHRDRMIAYAAQAVRFDPQNADNMMALARAMMMKGKEVEAMAAFTSTIELRPAWVEARTELAMSYWRQNRMTEATTELSRVLEAEPNNGFALERMAVASYYAGDHAAAWRFIDRATAAGHQVPPQLLDQLGQRSR